MLVRRVVAAVAACSLVVLAAGCAEDEPEPKMPEPTSSGPSPTPTESETPERESAEDFIRRWASVEREMENSGETSEYRDLSRDCEPCLTLASTIESYYAAGGYVQWDGWRVRAVRQTGAYGPDAYRVRVVSSRTTYVTRAGGPVQTLDGGPATHLLRLRPQGTSWVVIDKSEVPD